MTETNISELRQNLPNYIRRVQAGEEVVVTLHGKPVARIVPNREEDPAQAALARLAGLRGSVIVGDVETPAGEAWGGDDDHL